MLPQTIEFFILQAVSCTLLCFYTHEHWVQLQASPVGCIYIKWSLTVPPQTIALFILQAVKPDLGVGMLFRLDGINGGGCSRKDFFERGALVTLIALVHCFYMSTGCSSSQPRWVQMH